MISAIFQPEITTLEAQLAALQSRIALLKQAEGVTGDSLEALKTAIAKVTALAPDAIASLRTAVLNLFQGESNDDGNGNQPTNPAPKPCPEPVPQPEPLTGLQLAIRKEGQPSHYDYSTPRHDKP